MNYASTFPILINANGVPTYFLSLKDNAGLVKMYAFVSVENIQILSVTESTLGVEYGMQEYLKALNKDTSNSNATKPEILDKEITISEIYTATIEGNSYYYIMSSDEELYIASITSGKQHLPLIKIGDTIKVKCYKSNNYYDVTSVTK